MRAAVVQAAPALFDTPRSLDKLAALAAAAARQGAGLVVFPEAFVGGYPKGHDFGVSVGVRSPEGRDEFRRLFESAVEVPGPATERIGSVAGDHTLHLVVGVVVHSTSGLVTLRQLVLQAVRHLRHHLPFIAEKRAALGAGHS